MHAKLLVGKMLFRNSLKIEFHSKLQIKNTKIPVLTSSTKPLSGNFKILDSVLFGVFIALYAEKVMTAFLPAVFGSSTYCRRKLMTYLNF